MSVSRLVAVLLALVAGANGQVLLKLQPGDTICLVGGALGDSLAREGSFEALLQKRFPQQQLKLRSLCWPGDEVVRRPRPAGYPTASEALTREGASVVIGLFGFNESWGGQDGVEAFKTALESWVDTSLAAEYRGMGKGAPRLALATPVAAEPFAGGPDAKRLNTSIALYANAVRGVAAKKGLPVADLFAATEKAFAAGAGLTNNGVTPNDRGAARVAAILDNALFGRGGDRPEETLLQAVRHKSALFRQRNRPTNSDAIYGSRAGLGFEPDRTQTNGTVLGREMEILDALLVKADIDIWRAAGLKELPSADRAPAPIAVQTNFGSGRNRGKEGSTTYLKPSQAKRRFRTDEGYAIDLWASELDFPELANPTASCFDAAGRLWVACAPSYPGRRPDPGGDAAPDDKILVLDDFDHDGRADRCRVFADGLHLPTGLAVGDGGVYVAAAPDLLFLADSDGDWKADRRDVLLTGFGTANAHHAINSLNWGPDGALYFCEGSFDQTAVETAWGLVRLANGGVYRYHPRTRELRVHAPYNFTNAHGIAFDDWGNSAIADAATGGLYFGSTLSGDIDRGEKHAAARTFAKARSNPITAPTFVHGSHFPEDAQGDLLVGSCIAMLGALRFDLLANENMAGLDVEEAVPIVLTTDGNFRPVDLDFGPDGALFLTDWHNALLGHFEHHLRDPGRDTTHGRIWRVVYPARSLDLWPEMESQPPAKLLPLLAHGNALVRNQAKRELRKSPAKGVLATALKWGAGLDRAAARYEHTLIEILNLHEHFASPNTSLLRAALRGKRPETRAAATRLLAEWGDAEPGALSMLKVLVGDEDPRVRLEAVRACTFFDDPRALETVQLASESEMEGALEYTYKEAVKVIEKRFPAPAEP